MELSIIGHLYIGENMLSGRIKEVGAQGELSSVVKDTDAFHE